ncbi:purine/pyrimidine permease [Lentibacillus salicampi]|uniref:Uracil permease n=1 Tax=Lentibacillus salicampi TaxID=175306 RepID=A0A4Y9A9H1_9BACI|nr:purine/pyrimidine permease [Lentibacillus salicampi]TFJ91787.1 uracil permease [Lentibacillus salicampi]
MKLNMNTTLETVQWFVFLLASSVALPIVIGSMFDMNFSEVSGLMQRTFFAVGVTSFLQGWLGHRLPIMEGPAGLWISIFSVMAITGASQGVSSGETLRTLETTMLFAGAFLALFGMFKLTQKLLHLFTPLVTGSFLFLLTVQLSGTFLEGMLGIQQEAGAIRVDEALLAFGTFFLVLGLSTFGKGWLRNYAVLIGIGVGWISYMLVAGQSGTPMNTAVFSVPEWFAWGPPKLDFSVIPIAFITAIILLSNLVASVVAVSQAVYGKPSYGYDQINRGSMFVGVTHGVSAAFSTIANVPLASSSGFINLTGQKRKAPFMYAAILLAVLAFFPPVVSFISGIPAPIANAALLATFVQLMGLGLSNIASEHLDSRRLTILGVSFLIGIGTMFLPSEVFEGMPSLVQNLASNGLLIGTVLVILMERLWKNNEK